MYWDCIRMHKSLPLENNDRIRWPAYNHVTQCRISQLVLISLEYEKQMKISWIIHRQKKKRMEC